jgi:PAS domain S-box-containing protein
MDHSILSRQQLSDRLNALEAENHRLRQAQERPQPSSAQYSDLIEHAADAIFMGNAAGRFTDVNQSATVLTGYAVDELLGMSMDELFSPAEQERAPLRYDQLKQGETVQTERCLSRKDGSTVFVEMHSRMMPDGNYHCFMRDISERKQIERELRVSEEKFARAFKLSPDAVNINRLSDGVYIDINEGFTRAMGWTEEEVIGRSSLPGDLDIWCHAEDRRKLVDGLREHGEVLDLEASFRSKDGRVLIGLMSARVIEINGELCILSLTRDITERVKAEEERRQLEEKLLQGQKLESLGILAGGIAHDFNNILMAVIGHSDLAQKRLPAESRVQEHLQQIHLAADKAADLANQMLAYSGKGKFVIEALQFSRLIKEMEHILAVSIKKNIHIRYDLPPQLPRIEADATQMRQIIMNLVINASDAIGDKNGVIAVTSGAMYCDRRYLQETWIDEDLPAGPYAYVEVADTGCGMSPETVERIFDPFYSTKFTGRGLGMAAVLGIVRGHKGAVKIYTEIGKGSTIKVLFPTGTLSEPRREDRVTLPKLEASGTVLLVDDEEAVRSIGSEMLGEFGFTVITAVNGQQALEIFSQRHQEIRFILLDLTMPEMDGEVAFRSFRQIDPAVRVIICSGYNEQEVAQKFVGKGLSGFLKKPYSLEKLGQAIQKLTLE